MFGFDDAIAAIGDIGDTFLKQYFSKKNIRDQANLQYQYAQRYAENTPAWNIKGLRDAGLNPILAVSNGVNLGANIPNLSYASPRDGKIGETISASLDRAVARDNAEVNQQNADSNATTAEADMLRTQADVQNTKAETSLKLLEAEKARQELKGGGYKNPIVNDAVRGLKDVGDKLQQPNSPSNTESPSTYFENKPSYKVDTPFGSVQQRIDTDNEVTRITGKSIREVSNMSDAEKLKILKEAHSKKFKSRGYHIFTR